MCWARGLCRAPLSGRAGEARALFLLVAVVVGFLAVTSGGGALAPGFDVLQTREPSWFCRCPAVAGLSLAAAGAGSPYPWKRAALCIRLFVGLGGAGCRAHARGGGRMVPWGRRSHRADSSKEPVPGCKARYAGSPPLLRGRSVSCSPSSLPLCLRLAPHPDRRLVLPPACWCKAGERTLRVLGSACCCSLTASSDKQLVQDLLAWFPALGRYFLLGL